MHPDAQRALEALADASPEVRHSAAFQLRVHARDLPDEALARLADALADDGAFEEPTYDWAGPSGWSDTVLVADAAATALIAAGTRALPVLRGALEGTARRHALTAIEAICARPRRLSDDELARTLAAVPDTRAGRLLRWERRRRDGTRGGDAHLAEVEEALCGTDAAARRDAVEELVGLPGHPAAAAIALRGFVGGKAPGWALERIGPVLDAEDARRLLEAARTTPSSAVLRALAPYRDPALPELLVALLERSPAGPVRGERLELAAAAILAELGPPPSALRPRLLALLWHGHFWQVGQALRALGGPGGLDRAERERYVEHVVARLPDDASLAHVHGDNLVVLRAVEAVPALQLHRATSEACRRALSRLRDG